MLAKLNTLRNEGEEGFTLIELLVVILIIGILAAIAIPAFLNQRKSAVDATVESDVSNAAKAVENWAAKQTGYGAVIDQAALEASGELKTSEGVTLSITGTNTGGYCILGYHEGADRYTSAGAAATYDSAAGGLHRDGVVCAGGVNNEDGSVETPSATGFQVTDGSTTGELQATAAYNSYGSATITFTGDSAINGEFQANANYFCGTTQVSYPDSFYANLVEGSGSGDTMYIPTDVGCEVDGITIDSAGYIADYSTWDLTGTSPIIPLTGTAPSAPAPNEGGSETPTENNYPTTSLAANGTQSGEMFIQNMNDGSISSTGATWNLDYEVTENGDINYQFSTTDTTVNDTNAYIVLWDGGYGTGGMEYIYIYMNVVDGSASGTTNPGFAVDGNSIDVNGDYSQVGGHRLEYYGGGA